MTVLTALAALGSLVGVVLGTLTIREKLRKPTTTHPLEAALRDIAAAIRERGPDLHVRIDERDT